MQGGVSATGEQGQLVPGKHTPRLAASGLRASRPASGQAASAHIPTPPPPQQAKHNHTITNHTTPPPTCDGAHHPSLVGIGVVGAQVPAGGACQVSTCQVSRRQVSSMP